MLSPLAFSPLSCYLHTDFLTYPDHHFCSHASGHAGGMPCGGCLTGTALSPRSLPSTFSPLSKQHYRLSILQPANPSGQSLCSHYHSSCSHGCTGFFRQTKSFSNRSQGLYHPLHLLLCLFSSNLWEYFPTPCARQLLLASLSPILLLPPCLTPPVVKSFSAFSLTLLAATTWFPSRWIH